MRALREPDVFVHPSALVEDGAMVGSRTRIWHDAHVRAGARIGADCIVGKGAYVDRGVVVGAACKLQNYVCLYRGATLGRGVFVGPHAVFTNDVRPRAVAPGFAPLGDADWHCGTIVVGDGASIGANATILPNVKIGTWAMVGAGAVVTRDVEPYALVAGSPARRIGWVCACGARVRDGACATCGELPLDHPLR